MRKLHREHTRFDHHVFEEALVRLPGFEPGLEAWKASILDQSRSQPQTDFVVLS